MKSLRPLALKSFYHYRKSNIALILSAALCSCVITGSLILGDSIKESLKKIFSSKTGKVESVITSENRYFRSSLAAQLSKRLNINTSAIIGLKGNASSGGGSLKVESVNLYGINSSFFNFSNVEKKININEGHVLINKKTADALNLNINDSFTVKIPKPSALPSDSPFASKDNYISLRLTVQDILSRKHLGDFSLNINASTPENIFIDLRYLSEKLEIADKANTILLSESSIIPKIDSALKDLWTYEDTGLNIIKVPDNKYELRTSRVFISKSIENKILNSFKQPELIFSYFINSLGKTPYSIISAPPPSKYSLKENEIVINKWLADDNAVKTGSSLLLEYYVIDTDRRLSINKTFFNIKAVIPISGYAADKTLMPDFPGLSDAGSCKDWEPGIPIDLKKIRNKDEDYWDNYRGTPKAFVSLSTAKKLWGNQFGELTAVRFKDTNKDQLISRLNSLINPFELGIKTRDLKALQKSSAEQSVSFSDLFIGLNFFIVFSALTLLILFFEFYIENRKNGNKHTFVNRI